MSHALLHSRSSTSFSVSGTYNAHIKNVRDERSRDTLRTGDSADHMTSLDARRSLAVANLMTFYRGIHGVE